MADSVTCAYCDHFFDPSDDRGYVPQPHDPRHPPECPACTMMTLMGIEAWAVTNDCNGIFTCGLAGSRAEAQEHLASGRYEGAGCYVIPIRIYEEPEHRHAFREWVESRDEAMKRGSPAEPQS